jgi:hypothetical protein
VSKPVAALRIVLLAIAAACTYGVAHDLVTAHLCVEYFTVAHPPLFATEDPVLLALGWGVVATWWVGLPLGLLLAFAALRGPRPSPRAAALVRPVGRLLLAMAACALVAGVVGWLAGVAGASGPGDRLAARIPPERHARFVACACAHVASYAAGLFGGLWLVRATWRGRRTVAARP